MVQTNTIEFFYEILRIVKVMESKSTLVDARSQRGRGEGVSRGNGDLVFNEDRVHFRKVKKFRRQMMVRIVHVNVLSATELYS